MISTDNEIGAGLLLPPLLPFLSKTMTMISTDNDTIDNDNILEQRLKRKGNMPKYLLC